MRIRSLVVTAVCIFAAVLLTSPLQAAGPRRASPGRIYCLVSMDPSSKSCDYRVLPCFDVLTDPRAEIIGSSLPTQDKAEQMRIIVTRFCEDVHEVLADDADTEAMPEGEAVAPAPETWPGEDPSQETYSPEEPYSPGDADSPEEFGCFVLIDPAPLERSCELSVVACAELSADNYGSVLAGPFDDEAAAAELANLLSAACRDHLDLSSSREPLAPALYVWMSGDESRCEFHVLDRRDAGDHQDWLTVAGPFIDFDRAAEVAEAVSVACRDWQTMRELDPCFGSPVPQCSSLRV